MTNDPPTHSISKTSRHPSAVAAAETIEVKVVDADWDNVTTVVHVMYGVNVLFISWHMLRWIQNRERRTTSTCRIPTDTVRARRRYMARNVLPTRQVRTASSSPRHHHHGRRTNTRMMIRVYTRAASRVVARRIHTAYIHTRVGTETKSKPGIDVSEMKSDCRLWKRNRRRDVTDRAISTSHERWG